MLDVYTSATVTYRGKPRTTTREENPNWNVATVIVPSTADCRLKLELRLVMDGTRLLACFRTTLCFGKLVSLSRSRNHQSQDTHQLVCYARSSFKITYTEAVWSVACSTEFCVTALTFDWFLNMINMTIEWNTNMTHTKLKTALRIGGYVKAVETELVKRDGRRHLRGEDYEDHREAAKGILQPEGFWKWDA